MNDDLRNIIKDEFNSLSRRYMCTYLCEGEGLSGNSYQEHRVDLLDQMDLLGRILREDAKLTRERLDQGKTE